MNEIPAGEFQRVSTELGEAKAMLREERSKREADLNQRLVGIEGGIKSIGTQLTEFNSKKVDVIQFEKLSDDVKSHGRYISMGVGASVLLGAGIPFLIKIVWG